MIVKEKFIFPLSAEKITGIKDREQILLLITERLKHVNILSRDSHVTIVTRDFHTLIL